MLENLLMGWSVIVGLMTMAWGLYKWSKNPGVVDVFWAIGLFLLAPVYALLESKWGFHECFLIGMLGLWALRLALFLAWTRLRVGERDKRYTNMEKGWKLGPDIGYFFNYQFQGFLQVLLSFAYYPLFFNLNPQFISFSVQFTRNVPILWWISIAIFVLGLVGEHVADLQLLHFKKVHKGEKKVCDVGLWSRSRHPNLFFEWVIWLGISSHVVLLTGSFLPFFSPILLLLLMTQLTGPITERQSLESRGDEYRKYQKRVPYFFPRLFGGKNS